MEFTALYIDIDDNFFKQTGANKSYAKYVKRISAALYQNNTLVSEKSWKINPPQNDSSSIPYLHQCWEEIDAYLYNKTVVIYKGNFAVNHLLKTISAIKKITIPNPEYNDKEANEDIPKKIPKFPNAFKDCTNENPRFDYICLFTLCSRLFKDNYYLTINSFDDICKSFNVSTYTTPAAATGEIFQKVLNAAGTTDILNLKHMAGITWGEVRRNVISRTGKTEDTKNKIIDEDKMYVPCVAIDENDDNYRILDFETQN